MPRNKFSIQYMKQNLKSFSRKLRTCSELAISHFSLKSAGPSLDINLSIVLAVDYLINHNGLPMETALLPALWTTTTFVYFGTSFTCESFKGVPHYPSLLYLLKRTA